MKSLKLAKASYKAALKTGATKFFHSITPASEARVQRMAVAARHDRSKYFGNTESWGRGFHGNRFNRKGSLDRKNGGAKAVYYAEMGRREGGKVTQRRSVYRADKNPSLLLAKRAKNHDEQKHPRGPDGRWIAAGAIGLGALGLGAYLLLSGRKGAKQAVETAKAAAKPSVNAPILPYPSRAPSQLWRTPAPAPKPVFTPTVKSRLNEPVAPKAELKTPTVLNPTSKKQLTLADLKAAAKQAKEKGKLLVYRGYEDGPEFWGGKPDPSAIFEKPTESTWVTPNRFVANSWAKHPYNQKDKFRNNPTVQAFLLPRSGVVDLSDPNVMKEYRKYWASDLADRYRYKDIEERKRAAQYMRSAKFVPERQQMAIDDPDSYSYVQWDRGDSAKNIRAARYVINTGSYEGAPKHIEKKVWENFVSANKMIREPINNDYSSLKTYARKRGKSGVYDPGEMGSPPRIDLDTGEMKRDPMRGGFFLRHPQAIIYNKDALETLGRLPVKKSDGSLPMAKFALSEAELEQRRNAAKASAEARRRRGKGKLYGTDDGKGPGIVQGAWGQKGSGRDKEVRLKSSLGSHYRAHLDKEFSDVIPESAGRGGFKEFNFTPQKPTGMSDDDYAKISLRAGQVTKALKDPILQGAMKTGKIPPGTDPKTVNRAFAHARLLALHEVGLGRYHFRMEDQTKEAMKPMVPFIWYARRRLTQDPQGLRPQFKGEWKQFKDEYGEPFKDNRKDPRTGEVRRRFYPHMELLRADRGDLRKGWGSKILSAFSRKTPSQKLLAAHNAQKAGFMRAHEADKAKFRTMADNWSKSQRAMKADGGIDLSKAWYAKALKDGTPKVFDPVTPASQKRLSRFGRNAHKSWKYKIAHEDPRRGLREDMDAKLYDGEGPVSPRAAFAVKRWHQKDDMTSFYSGSARNSPPPEELYMNRKKLAQKADGGLTLAKRNFLKLVNPAAGSVGNSFTGRAVSSIWNGARSIAPQAWQKLSAPSSTVFDGVGAGMRRGARALGRAAIGKEGVKAMRAQHKTALSASLPKARTAAANSTDPIKTRAQFMNMSKPAGMKTRSYMRNFPKGRALDIGAGAALAGGAGYMMTGSNRQQPTNYRMY